MDYQLPPVSADDVLLHAKDQVVKHFRFSVLNMTGRQWNRHVMKALDSIVDEDYITIYNRYTRKRK